MRKMVFILILDAIFSSLISRQAIACTAFSIHRGDSLLVVGKNYDWDLGDGLIIINKRNVTKTAFGQANPAAWVSRFGSVTFNQYGRDMPSGGINEAGLVAEVLWLNDSRYPSADNRPSIGNLQWIQYQLDNFSTIDQVIASDTLLRIAPAQGVNVHYFICDSSGQSAVIEFLDGRLASFSHENLPVAAITNNTYEECLNFVKTREGFGGTLAIGARDNSVDVYSREASFDRFAHAAKCIRESDSDPSGDLIDYAFTSLNETESGSRTQWSIVYDIPGHKIYYKTSQTTALKKIDMKLLDLSCQSPVRVLDINSPESGEVNAKFEQYSFEINLHLIRRAFGKTRFLRGISPEFLARLAGYPDTQVCSE